MFRYVAAVLDQRGRSDKQDFASCDYRHRQASTTLDDGVSVPFAACAKLLPEAIVLVFRCFGQQLGIYSGEWQRRF
jgi:hypothetical protein